MPSGDPNRFTGGAHDSRRAAIEFDASKQASDSSGEVKYKHMGWKGVDVEPDEEYEPEVAIQRSEPIPEEDIDMTPMIDVTFLLLIFFMVTASFTLQKSFQQPPSQTDDPSPNVKPEEDEVEDYVEVIIDQNNVYYITTRDEEEREAASDAEMRSQVMDAKNSLNARRLTIKAHVDSAHSKVVTVWDAGILAGMEPIELKTTEDEY